MAQLITAEFLRSIGATCSQVAVFKREWPNGTEITDEALARAHALGLDVAWLARNASAPAEALARLAGDADVWVRECVARNASAPAEALAAARSRI